ncbi:hypothetical protein [Rhodospirillum rubrum]|uniref:Uncharacterized protein n=1 Tax=Rhodospirillum rubrum (strain ATCC 11170 / ATH 1.1.1 / DSM 467 / LMG 4362 / NCIMB 8255 / S1) TaxID=269796 RepID=Q2RW20_RHORT|nr:hypothetical protein [Rhodospirillum rubrum]ABC21675.1 hypothetical protein Rru_A0874 [Rhodospirillum rubrum ATCC 11170]AEO47373.1 hypothetical protein F11_04515 [Rhodospirillum rubrum F11]MBK5953227.1 hypothetical protein [Rhodospirillum rubrum]QXG81339.1 hypothetical protein KUL73_04565 [Rhodospirillum rubrum]HAQ01463.1 hypothetical protein [Rhodospirillum rubrum]
MKQGLIGAMGVVLLLGAAEARAQDLNQRVGADPGLQAKTNQLYTKAGNQSARKGEGLIDNDIISDCPTATLGATETDSRRSSLRETNETVIRGDVIYRCK